MKHVSRSNETATTFVLAGGTEVELAIGTIPAMKDGEEGHKVTLRVEGVTVAHARHHAREYVTQRYELALDSLQAFERAELADVREPIQVIHT